MENILYAGFNQDYRCFVFSNNNGFKIYNTDTFRETFQRSFNGGIGHVEMLFRCNILALIGGGRNPKYHPNKVIIWDDHQNKCIGELSFRLNVKNVKLRKDIIVVVVDFKTYIYRFFDLKLIEGIDTCYNKKGLCCINYETTENNVIATLGNEQGSVRVQLSSKVVFIQAHISPIVCMELNFDGSLLATASEKGTIIRIFDTYNGYLKQELRRGKDQANIYSIAFNETSEFLAVSSDKGTIHVFSILNKNNPEKKIKTYNIKSSLSYFRNFLPRYFSSEWSFAQFYIPCQYKSCVGFSGLYNNTLSIITEGGKMYKAVFNPDDETSNYLEEIN